MKTEIVGRMRWVEGVGWHIEIEKTEGMPAGTVMPAETLWFGLAGRRVAVTIEELCDAAGK